MIKTPTLPATARVWIYQANQPFREADIPQIKKYVDEFAQSWVSHNRQLTAHGDVLHNRFVVLMVDENTADASGCSIDKSVHFMQQLGQAYGVDLFDRMTFSWMENEEVKSAKSDEFAQLYASGKITDDTLVFDNLVKTKGELDEKWLKPLNESWHKRFV
jgi:hypothetical protein